MRNPHVLVIPCPAQGHVIPLMELALNLAKHGFKVTFVNTDFTHEQVMKALPRTNNVPELVQMVPLPDGLGSSDDRSDIGKLLESIFNVMPRELKALIERIHGSGSERISCLIADSSMGWALEVADKMGIKKVAFCPTAAAILALLLKIPSLIDDGIINSDGEYSSHDTHEVIILMGSKNLYNFSVFFRRSVEKSGDPNVANNACHGNKGFLLKQKCIFKFQVKCIKPIKSANRIICNSSNMLEPGTFASYPDFLPMGPLLASNRQGQSTGYFWQEDSGCLKWLDQQPPNSVIYVAFGSSTILDRTQFQELALGLELTNRPFLWVVRQNIIEDLNNAFPAGFQERVKLQGHFVSCVPQQKVLSHPSIACFISHCGWNSTIEGISNGVPFLCWPYFADQMFNQSYICDYLKIGLKLDKDDYGIISHEEIKNKLERVLGEERFKERALDLQVKILNSVTKGGGSENLQKEGIGLKVNNSGLYSN